MQYRGTRAHGGTYFFTVVTHLRRRFLCEPGNVAILREAFRSVMAEHPVQMDAIVVLPDHMHAVWTLPANDCDYSTRWRLVKTYFSRRSHVPLDGPTAGSRLRKKERTVWQRRFWEHLVRDDEDLIAHVEYIHYNPVKHGLVRAPKDWAYSSFHWYVREGMYAEGWGAGKVMSFQPGVGAE